MAWRTSPTMRSILASGARVKARLAPGSAQSVFADLGKISEDGLAVVSSIRSWRCITVGLLSVQSSHRPLALSLSRRRRDGRASAPTTYAMKLHVGRLPRRRTALASF